MVATSSTMPTRAFVVTPNSRPASLPPTALHLVQNAITHATACSRLSDLESLVKYCLPLADTRR